MHWAHCFQSLWWSAGSTGQACEPRWRKRQQSVSTVALS